MTILRSFLIERHAHVLLSDDKPLDNRFLVLGFHGYAERAETQLQRLYALELAPEAFLLCAIEAPHRFYWRNREVVGSWMTREYRGDEISDGIHLCHTLLTSIIQIPQGSRRVILFGFSQGAALAYRFAAAYPLLSKYLVAIGSDIPPELDEVALKVFPPLLLVHGEADTLVSVETQREASAKLRAAGVTAQTILHPGGHHPPLSLYSEIGEILAKITRTI